MGPFKTDFKTNERIRQDQKFARLVEVIRRDPAVGTDELRERFGLAAQTISRARLIARSAA